MLKFYLSWPKTFWLLLGRESTKPLTIRVSNQSITDIIAEKGTDRLKEQLTTTTTLLLYLELLSLNYLFSFQRYSSFLNVQISQVMMSSTPPNFDQIWYKKRYLSQFASEMFDSLQQDSTKGAPQYELRSFVTMATYWVPDFPNIKGFSGLLQRSVFILANGAS